MDFESPFANRDVEKFLLTEFQNDLPQLQRTCTWLMSPPTITTFRINTLITSPLEVKKIIDATLREAAELKGIKAPKVWVAEPLSDVLVIDRWNYETFVPDESYPEVMVDTYCGAAILRGAQLFAPGVLSMPKWIKYGQTVNIFADLEGHCLKGLAITYKGKKKFVGCGEVKMTRSDLFGTELPPNGVAVQVTFSPSGCPILEIPHHLGILQNLPSSLAVWELDPQPGESVLDMCAAPGNKTTHLATLMKNQGILVALDRNENKAKLVRESCERLSARCQVFAWDSTKAVAANSDKHRRIEEGPPFQQGSFDKVLLDAPCSALGQRPQLLNKISLSQVKSHPALQRKLFDAAVQLTKVGGELVYSTCSLTYSENECVVASALKRHDLTLLPPRHRMSPVDNIPQNSALSDDQRLCVQRFGPPVKGASQQYWDTIGFFIARFRKNL